MCSDVLKTLPGRIAETLQKPYLDPALVVEACHALSQQLQAEAHEPLLTAMGIPAPLARAYIADAKWMLSREYLQHKLETELGRGYGAPIRYQPAGYDQTVTEQQLPLGVLFHIAAGNMDGLPVFTVIEGLLTGNINLLKLPAQEGGLSVQILRELIKLQPLLSEYIYVFDISSKDREEMQALAEVADAVVVWGGDAVIEAVRAMAKPNTKMIEWGHKVSFAYVSGADLSEEALSGIAENICSTNQLLCSSCQGIFVDTDSMEEVERFGMRFLPILEKMAAAHPHEMGIGVSAQVGLRLYTEQLESLFQGARVFKGKDCSMLAYPDSALDTAILFRNGWIKRLPRERIIPTLHPYKNRLQTVGLLCPSADRQMLSDCFFRAGAVRVTDGRHMSRTYRGAAHDGEYPLRRYTKIATLEQG